MITLISFFDNFLICCGSQPLISSLPISQKVSICPFPYIMDMKQREHQGELCVDQKKILKRMKKKEIGGVLRDIAITIDTTVFIIEFHFLLLALTSIVPLGFNI